MSKEASEQQTKEQVKTGRRKINSSKRKQLKTAISFLMLKRYNIKSLKLQSCKLKDHRLMIDEVIDKFV